MAGLSENQLLLLDNLIYLEGVAVENQTVESVINKLLYQGGLDLSKYSNGEFPAQMNRDEWVTILHNIEDDPTLMSLKITNPLDNSSLALGGARIACFVREDEMFGDECTVVFRGTVGDSEWIDNGEAEYNVETSQQKEALEYINGLAYDNITVTGHSKGGNKAQYVAILSDKVDRCVSFDGQGFSKEFLAEYKDQIIDNSWKITSIADSWDFVNCLLFPLAKTIYIDSGYVHELAEFTHNHCPNTMLNGSGELRNATGPSIVTKIVSALTQYINTVLPDSVEKQYTADLIMSKFGNFEIEADEEMLSAPVIIVKELLESLEPMFESSLPHTLFEQLEFALDAPNNLINFVTNDLIPYIKNSANYALEAYLDIYPVKKAQWESEYSFHELERSINNQLTDSNNLNILMVSTQISNDDLQEIAKQLMNLEELKECYRGILFISDHEFASYIYDNCPDDITASDLYDATDYAALALKESVIKNTGLLGDIISLSDRYNELMRYFAMEVGEDLINLFDEIDGLFTSSTEVVTPRRIFCDPILIDLDGDGIEVGSDRVYFDLDKNGFAEKTGWVKGDDGLLVMDRDGDGKINNGGELFGDQTVLINGTIATSGFQALTELDENLDGKIDSSDTSFVNIKIWKDSNEDGYSASGELFSLEEIGISSINLNYIDVNVQEENGNIMVREGNYEKADGTIAAIGEFLLNRDERDTFNFDYVNVSQDIAELPNMLGFGNVDSLHQAMAKDESGELKVLVEAFKNEQSIANRNALIEQIIFKWTGSDAILQDSRGGNFDARKLAVLEKFLGRSYVGSTGANPIAGAASILTLAYTSLFEKVYSKLMLDSHLKEIVGLIQYTTVENVTKGDLVAVQCAIEVEIVENYDKGIIILSEFARAVKGYNLEDDIGFTDFRNYFSAISDDYAWIIDSAGAATIVGGTDNDRINGTNTADTIAGNEGNDTLIGNNGDDILYGQAGDDILSGGDGNDNLIGGTGSDSMFGGVGNDTYTFKLGYGVDTIKDDDSTAGNTDIIIFGEGIFASNITIQRVDYNLEVRINGTTDKLILESYFSITDQSVLNNNNKIEEIHFSDGTIWNHEMIMSNITFGTEVAETIYGTVGDDIINGLGGNDNIYAGNGNDILIGGAGDDYLNGGCGNDTYIFKLGDGVDTIFDVDNTGGNIDKIVFDEGISEVEVILLRVGNNLEVRIDDTTDKLILQNYFSSSYQSASILTQLKIEEMHFADGTIWDDAKIMSSITYGTELTDIIYGTVENDILNSLGGNDIIYAGNGNDTLNGGEGIDTLYAESGDDILIGGAGNDKLIGGYGNDSYIFNLGDGVDTINDNDSTAGNADKIVFGEGISASDVTILRVGSNLEVRIDGTTDKLILQNYYSAANQSANILNQNKIEEIQFADGTIWDDAKIMSNICGTGLAETIYGTIENDIIDGLGGNDIIYAGNGNDTLNGGEGNDSLYAENGDDIIVGGVGNDSLNGGYGNDTYIFNLGDGVDTINDNDSTVGNTDKIEFGEGISASDVTILRLGTNLEVRINSTTDKLILQNYYSSSSQSASIRNQYKIEEIHFVDGTIWNDEKIMSSITFATEAAETIYGTVGNDVINGLGGNDIIYAGNGNDILSGNMGNDSLNAENGDDVLSGAEGDDTLIGGYGNDSYIFNLGDGVDTIIENDSTAGNTDKIVFGEGISESDITILRVGYNLEVRVKDTTDKLILKNYYSYADQSANTSSNFQYKIEEIHFADGTIWNDDKIMTSITYGTEAAETICGTVGDDVINGLGGDDYIYSGNGNDILSGNMGNDSLYAEDGDDILSGAEGNDTLSGGYGNDTYIFNLGDGVDTIIENDSTVGNTDKIVFGEGISASDITILRVGTNLEVRINCTSEKLILQNYFTSTGYDASVNSQNNIEKIHFSDGTIWDNIKILSSITYGTEATETIYGTIGNDVINGLGGNDSIYAGEGNNIISGDEGNDYINSENGDDVITGGVGNDTINAGGGDDIIIGGTGDDTISGGYGNDTYFFNLGDGVDTIYEGDNTVGNTDKIVFGEGISASDITIFRAEQNLEVSVNGTTDKLILRDYYNSKWESASVNNQSKIEEIHFADGTIWDDAKIMSSIAGTNADEYLYGTVGNDSISGLAGSDNIYTGDGNDTLCGDEGNDYLDAGNGDDILRGGVGNDSLEAGYGNDNLEGGIGDDYLSGGDGNDTLIGGAGSDHLKGGYGNDTYFFNLGDGEDQIYDYDTTAGNIDRIIFGEGISASNITIYRIGYNLEVRVNNSTDKLILLGYYDSIYESGNVQTANKIEEICFVDGTIWNDEWIMSNIAAETIYGTESAETIYGSYRYDVINGLGGNDSIYADDGNDIINGGTGNDSLYGSHGNDTYIFNLGDGVDNISDLDSTVGNIDKIVFGEGITASDVLIIRAGYNLEVRINGTTDKLILQSYFTYSGKSASVQNQCKIEEIYFADGTIWDDAKIMSSISGTEAAETIYGTVGNDVISGLGGNDTIYIGLGNDIINGDAGNDSIYADDGDDFLYGGVGDDYLSGMNGNDTLAGGVGNDTLSGGNGNDTYMFNLGDGVDYISEYDTTAGNIDKIVFGEGISTSTITVVRKEYNLEIRVNNTTDKLILQDYYTTADHSVSEQTQYKIEEFYFVDGTIWDDVKLMSSITEEVFTINGTAAAETIYGTIGNDDINGFGGNDTLNADKGNDILRGGVGNDILNGGYGNDTYIFNLGDGVDSITDNDPTVGNVDKIVFGEGILVNNITICRVGNNLEMRVNGTTDKLILKSYYSSTNQSANIQSKYKIEEIYFADGTIWDDVKVMASITGTAVTETIYGTAVNDMISGLGGDDTIYVGLGNDIINGDAGKDKLYGENGDDILNGGLGDDYLSGGNGNDILTGGAGNDSLIGGIGNDTYIFNRGDGVDNINDYDTSSTNKDAINFNEELVDIMFKKNGTNLEITNHNNDKVIISSWFSNSTYQIEAIKATDGSILANTQVSQLIQAMSTFSTTKGMSWDQVATENSDEYRNILNQFWVKN